MTPDELTEALWDLFQGCVIHATSEECFRVHVANALRAAVAEEREACARVAEQHESAWSTEHPVEAYKNALQNVIGNAFLGGWDKDHDDEPEHAIAEAVYTFLTTGVMPIHRILRIESTSAAIRART